jgi:hypothetical protein
VGKKLKKLVSKNAKIYQRAAQASKKRFSNFRSGDLYASLLAILGNWFCRSNARK